jgi:hypothetical protein
MGNQLSDEKPKVEEPKVEKPNPELQAWEVLEKYERKRLDLINKLISERSPPPINVKIDDQPALAASLASVEDKKQ